MESKQVDNNMETPTESTEQCDSETDCGKEHDLLTCINSELEVLLSSHYESRLIGEPGVLALDNPLFLVGSLSVEHDKIKRLIKEMITNDDILTLPTTRFLKELHKYCIMARGSVGINGKRIPLFLIDVVCLILLIRYDSSEDPIQNNEIEEISFPEIFFKSPHWNCDMLLISRLITLELLTIEQVMDENPAPCLSNLLIRFVETEKLKGSPSSLLNCFRGIACYRNSY